MKKLKILFTLFFCFMAFSVSGQGNDLFYFSSEKTFSPNEKKRIKLESSPQLKTLQVRVYRIKDPVNFYLNQQNLHRPEVGKRQFRRLSLEVADGLFNYLKSGVQGWAREKWPNQNRKNSLSFLPDLKGKLEQAGVSFSTVVKPIADSNFQLIKEFIHSVPVSPNSYSWNYSYVFLEDLKEGAYLVEGVEKGFVAYTVLNISDFGFILKKSDHQVLVYAVDNENGSPAKNIDLTVFDRFKKKKDTWETDKQGLSINQLEENDFFLIGKSEKGSFSFYDPKYYPSASKNLRIYMYTDRPVYRGGDEVNLKGIIRRYDNGEYFISGSKEISIEIVSQKGEVVANLKANANDLGTFDQKFNLPAQATSGRYMILADVDGQKHEAEFKVEYYQKPEFEVKVKIEKPFYVGGEKISAEIQSLYYYGEPLRDSKVKYSVYRSRFLGGQNAEFLSQQEATFAQMELLYQGDTVLDSGGTAKIKVDTKKEKDLYLYYIEARVIDKNGIGITAKSKVEVVASTLRISASAEKFLYLLGERVELKLLTQNYYQQPISSVLNVKISSQLGPNQIHVFFDEKINTDSNGQKLISFKAEKTGFVKIEIIGRDQDGNLSTLEKFLWIGEEGAAYFYRGGMVQMVLDKPSYKVGETAKLLLLSPVSDVPFLFTLEGDSIYKYKVERFNKNSAMILIPVEKNFAPNVFATVQFLFQNQIYSNSIQLRIPAVNQQLNIQVISNKAVYHPGENAKVRIQVKDYAGNPVKNAEVSLAVVDEAIYAISPELAVNISDFFYPFRRNNIKTWNSIGFRFYGYSKNAKEQLANLYKAPTGLGAFKEREAKDRKNFKDTMLWLPGVKTDGNGEADIQFSFPDNITRWRFTAVGVTEDTKVGKVMAYATTKMSVFAQVSHPYYINENDKFVFYSTVHNLTANPIQARVSITGENLIFAKKEQEITLDPNSVKNVEWEGTPSRAGAAGFTIDVKSVEFKDKMTKKLTVMPHSIFQTKTSAYGITGEDNKASFDLPKNIKNNSLVLELNVSYGYYSIIASALPYLIGYPWGCVEQTTSSFLPNLVALKTFSQLGIQNPEAQKNLPDILSKGLARLYQFQNPNGGWGWWNENQSDPFMTAYVLYALTLTKDLGRQINYAAHSRAIQTLITLLPLTRTQTEKMFALYVLSLNKKFFYGMMEEIEKDKSLNSYSTALLALTYHKAGKLDKAKEVLNTLKQKKKTGIPGTVYWADENGYEWYRDSIEATAWAIRAINAIEYDKDLIAQAVNYLMLHREGSQWKSTRDTSAVVYALSDLMSKEKNNSEKEFTLLLNGRELGRLEVGKKEYQTRLVYHSSMISKMLKESSNQIEVKGINGNEKGFLSVSLSYFTNQDKINESSAGISVKRSYFELESYTGADGTLKYKAGLSTTQFNKGKDILVKLTLYSNKSGNYLMLEDYYPAGTSPVKDFKLYQVDYLKKYRPPNYVDYRDEKAGFFITSMNQPVEIYYVLRANYTGKYKVLPAQGRLMYFPVISGNSNDADVNIK